MTDWLAKLDNALRRAYADHLAIAERGAGAVQRTHPIAAGGRPFYVHVRYRGDLSDLEDAGFESITGEREGVALGVMRIERIEEIARHPAIIALEIGAEAKARLEHSIPDVRADQVWTKVMPGNTFTGQTGKDVIVGIIDSGIDYRHVDFLKTGSDHVTRILRIWDMGLTPTGTEHGPDASLLSGGATYGVEYTGDQIEADLHDIAPDSPPAIRHMDCDGHGTHVASIAAGSGRADTDPRTGVAPEAWIVAVRYLRLPVDPVDTAGVSVTPLKRFKDAVSYVLQVAAAEEKPVVLNMSFGWDLGSHDGTSEREFWLATEFAASSAGRACVVAAGNENYPAHSHVEVEFPAAGGERRVPFRLLDERELRSDWVTCTWKDSTEELELEFWYVRDAHTVQAAVKVPDRATTGAATTRTSSFVGVGDGTGAVSFAGGKTFELEHKEAPDVTLGSHMLQRNCIHLTLKPQGQYHEEATDVYELILQSDGPTQLEGWTSSVPPQYLLFGHVANMLTLSAGVTAPERHQITDPAGARNVVAVAAYSAEPDPPPASDDPFYDDLAPHHHEIVFFSSRGGLVDYAGLGSDVVGLEPDLSAPGYHVDAAASMGRGWLRWRSRLFRSAGYEPRNGTSMAAPHVAGTVALMLGARPDLTVAEILSILTDPANLQARPTSPDPATDAALRATYGAGLLDVEKVMDAVAALP